MEIQYRRLSDITPYDKNAKTHDQTQINNVAESIRQYGFVQPIVVDRDGVIVIGHCRALAAKKLGMETVPCVCVDDLTPEQVKALRLVDNKTNESPWDFDLLVPELGGLDLDCFDFDWGIPVEDSTEVQEDDAPEADETQPPVTKLGDVWKLGRHRLMCGDSTSAECVQTLVGGDKQTSCLQTHRTVLITLEKPRTHSKSKTMRKRMTNSSTSSNRHSRRLIP